MVHSLSLLLVLQFSSILYFPLLNLVFSYFFSPVIQLLPFRISSAPLIAPRSNFLSWSSHLVLSRTPSLTLVSSLPGVLIAPPAVLFSTALDTSRLRSRALDLRSLALSPP
eukprot:3648581-Pleurochrysis_carterae.AAC.4